MNHHGVLTEAGFSGRIDNWFVSTLHLAHIPRARSYRRFQRLATKRVNLQAARDRGFGDVAKDVARQLQGALPIVGLLSRLAAPSGGVGRDEVAYPEYARQILDKADPEFNGAVAEWETRYGRIGQRKYVLLFLWMARTGLGLVPSKQIGNAALRLRVTHDITMEVERFEAEREKALQIYTYAQRPSGKVKEQIWIAVDAFCRLAPGLKDGQPIAAEDQKLLVPIISHAFSDFEGYSQIIQEAVSDVGRASRKSVNQ